MGVPPIPGKKLAAFAKKKDDNPMAKLAKKHGDGDEEDPKPDHEEPEGKDKGPKVDLAAAEDGATAHDDDEIEEHMGHYDPEVDGNPPDFITDEGKWAEAKKAVQPKWDSYDEPYAVVAYVYKQMGGGFKKKD